MQDPKKLRRWMTFSLESQPNGSVKKIPVNPNGGLASCDDPSTWVSYEEAYQYFATHENHSLGFVLGKEVGLVVFDIDKARPTKDAAWPEWVEREVAELDSFTEMSVSGLGRHVWVWGSIPANRHNKARQVELHDSNKMFCVSQEFAENWTAIKERDLSELYARVDGGRIGPDYKPAPVVHAYNEAKFRALMAGEIEPHFDSRSEAVASVLCTLAIKHAGNEEKMREEFEASKLRELWGDKWDRLGDRELARAIAWLKTKRTQDGFHGQQLEFNKPAVARGEREYVLRPKDKFDGWFPRGSVSVIGGPSGAGKTTIMLELLEKQWKGEKYLGHEGGRLLYLVLFADREEEDNDETLDRMNLKGSGMAIECLPLCWDFAAVSNILRAIEAQPKLPAAVLIEGGDMLPSKPNELPIVAQLVKHLQLIAKQYRVAIILSVGAPKSTPDKQHALMRDRIFGSQVWGRMASTIVTMSIPGDGTGAERQLDAQHRNAPSEKFELSFENGLLVQRTSKVDMDVFELWASQLDGWFTIAEAAGAMEVAGAPFSKPAVKNKIVSLHKKGALKQKYDGKSKVVYQWVHEDSSEPVALEHAAAS